MKIVQKCYRFRLKPTAEQERIFLRLAGARRFVWNWGLARRKEFYEKTGKTLSSAALSKELTQLKYQPETIWLQEAPAQLLQQPLRDLEGAFGSFFAGRTRYPKFKSRKSDKPRFRFPERAKLVDDRVWVPKVGWVAVIRSRDIEGETKSATFTQDGRGRWHVTFIAHFQAADTVRRKPADEKTVGIDTGLIDFAVFSNGERIQAPKFYKQQQSRLAKLSRSLQRKAAGSKRREKARKKVASLHQKIRDQRTDFLHKLSSGIIKRFDGVAVESLNLKGLARTKLAKSFSDSSIGEFVKQLTYKANWNAKSLIAIDRFYPSSKTCSSCGRVNDALTLDDRTWICDCGASHDRDLNAALNIKSEGLRMLAVGYTDSQNARRDDVRPLHSKAVVTEARIPSGNAKSGIGALKGKADKW